MAGELTTHALDTVLGAGARGMAVEVRRDGQLLAAATLDARGRAKLLAGLEAGVYALSFDVAAYHRAMGVALSDPPFLGLITITIGVADPEAHYHVPLLIAPHGYSTYRGG